MNYLTFKNNRYRPVSYDMSHDLCCFLFFACDEVCKDNTDLREHYLK